MKDTVITDDLQLNQKVLLVRFLHENTQETYLQY